LILNKTTERNHLSSKKTFKTTFIYFTVQKNSVKTFLHLEFWFMWNIKTHFKFKSKLDFKSIINSTICGLWSVGHI